MTTKTDMEIERRFTILEEQGKQNLVDHQDIMKQIENINKKLDIAIDSKADKSSVEKLSDKVWWFIGIFATAFIGVISFIIQSNLK